ncbi:MAG: hypothetical protein Q8Q31_03435 [Nanoarchaeota archaeon]|nr:hypothetical protein [Nanoarchaeota archaeon]
MRRDINKRQAMEEINEFFKQEEFTSENMKKIKRMAMKYKIRLGEYRRMFCKKCLSKLKGKTTIRKGYKNIKCRVCGATNRQRINLNKYLLT